MSTTAASTSTAAPPANGSNPANDSTTAVSTTDGADDALPTDSDSDDIHAKLKELRLDEVPGLSQNPSNIRTINAAHHYVQLFFLETGRYIRFSYRTLTTVVSTTLFGGLGLFDTFSIWVFGLGSIAVLFLFLIWCLTANIPILVKIYFWWSGNYGGGLGLMNAGNPNLFKALTPEQAAAAKEGLGKSYKDSPSTSDHHQFDLDIAKMLLQIAAVTYEHECDAIREAVGLLTNKPPLSPSAVGAAGFNPAFHNIGGVQPVRPPGSLLTDLWSPQISNQAAAALDSEPDQHIRDFVARFGMEFEPISELNTTSSAFVGLFWDRTSNWIVVSFKGTAPIEFGEWLSDMNALLVDCADDVPGYSKCHIGFKERVFPANVANLGGFKPYDTIMLGVKTLAKWLKKQNNFPKEKKINVWFTGHSLGCATASLAYSRLLMHDEEIGKHAVVRDAYLFAAPILTDRPSVDVFNNKMFEKKSELKTMWRITSNGDIVATGLPDLGDHRNIAVSPNNGFAFAHLGSELTLKDHPTANDVSGHHITFDTPVSVYSKFDQTTLNDQRATYQKIPGEKRREEIGVLLQKIPLFGRVLAHLTIFYWDHLDRIGTGSCEWVAV